MSNPENVTLNFNGRRLPFQAADNAGMYAYEYFYSNTEPTLSLLTPLSYSIRHYDDDKTLDAPMRRSLTIAGFLRHGENIPLRRRLTLPGVVAVALVAAETEDGKLAGEYLEEPFREIPRLSHWYGKASGHNLKIESAS